MHLCPKRLMTIMELFAVVVTESEPYMVMVMYLADPLSGRMKCVYRLVILVCYVQQYYCRVR